MRGTLSCEMSGFLMTSPNPKLVSYPSNLKLLFQLLPEWAQLLQALAQVHMAMELDEGLDEVRNTPLGSHLIPAERRQAGWVDNHREAKPCAGGGSRDGILPSSSSRALVVHKGSLSRAKLSKATHPLIPPMGLIPGLGDRV